MGERQTADNGFNMFGDSVSHYILVLPGIYECPHDYQREGIY
jgi:hypothetical protein